MVKKVVLKEQNKKRYDQLWRRMDIQRPEIWSTWQVIREVAGEKNLETGPGNYPRIPVRDGYFLDTSGTVVLNLRKAGAKAFLGTIEKMNFPDNFFDSVVACDVLEHVEDDKRAFSEIARVLKPCGFFLFSIPLRKEEFSELDQVAGHKRRYEISDLMTLVSKNGFKLVKWRPPSLNYWWIGFCRKLPFFWKIFLQGYSSKRSFRVFGLPKLFVNFLVKLVAFVDRAFTPAWQEDIETLENFKGRGVMLLCQKIESGGFWKN